MFLRKIRNWEHNAPSWAFDNSLLAKIVGMTCRKDDYWHLLLRGKRYKRAQPGSEKGR
ncbi:hypothetical protein SERLA73DRAFT_176641 [Serpula lacrymans var. lacrymans S7.3]|uniref:Uncharacterized protein n=2 Tax=Serpula lacrymans var. lacrymans TaxID=341189 RepID=F8PND9_SERL3|nr:uncharacterized protein SERLADRAFT_459765 [Serpula lacrymans var. lacrymans S7.9]EGO03121.1 hypothetical protein SERLA73DRAFT_176641 [Serpula lacrymans var. lacrymans S7.3]EGO28887.1 hypothetical protein SERLADRAFT_459765 [Serpula lacrymans var. lacrymans S7.9]